MLVNFSAAMTTPTTAALRPSPPRATETPTKMGIQLHTSVTPTAYWARKDVSVRIRRLNTRSVNANLETCVSSGPMNRTTPRGRDREQPRQQSEYRAEPVTVIEDASAERPADARRHPRRVVLADAVGSFGGRSEFSYYRQGHDNHAQEAESLEHARGNEPPAGVHEREEEVSGDTEDQRDDQEHALVVDGRPPS